MVDVQLTCNSPNCHKKLNNLNNQACVTSCSHIFCSEHLKSMVGNDKRNACLACGTQFGSELDYAQIDLNPCEQYKTMVLMGLNPDQILEIANRAIGFFVYQLNYNNKNKENVLKHMKEQSEELKHYCSSLTAKFKADLQKEQRKTEGFKQELEEKIRELELQQQQIEQCKKANKKLQMQLESQKREIVNMRAASTSGDNSTFIPHPHLTRNPNFQSKFREPTHSYPFHHVRSSNGSNAVFGSSVPFFASPFKSYGRFSH